MKLAEAYVDITTRTKKFMAGLRMVRTKLTASMRRMAGIAKQWGRRIGIALAAAFTAAIWAATKFEEQMANVSTMLTETTMKAMRGFERGIKRLAVAFGQSTETLSKGLYDILSASIASSKAMGVLEISARAAIAGMTDTAKSVDVITGVLNAYGFETKEANRVSDALFATVKAGKITFAELAQHLGMVLAPAAAAGESIEELLAALATLTRANVKPRIAITYLRQALMAFAKSTPDAMKAAEKFGFTLETDTLRTIGLVGVLKKLENANESQIAAIFSSNEAYNAMITLKGNVLGLERDLAAQYKASGSTLEAYNKIAKTAAQWFKRIRQQIVIMAAEIGKIFLPALKRMSKAILDNQEKIKFFVYNVVAKAWNKLLDIFALTETVLRNWSDTWGLAMDTAGFAIEQFVKNAKHYLVTAIGNIYDESAQKVSNWAEKISAIVILQERQVKESRKVFGVWISAAEQGSKAFSKMHQRQNNEMAELLKHYNNLTIARTESTKRELSAEDKATQKSLAARWAAFSKDLAKRSKKYDKYRATIYTKEMQMYQKLFDFAKEYWNKIIGLWTEGEERKTHTTEEEAAKRKSAEPEFVGLAEGWKRVQLAAMKAAPKPPSVGPKTPEKIQQGQLTELQQIKKTGKETLNWFKKAFTQEPQPAPLG